ncbi:MAG: hypothetical protein KGL95_13300, partial [Patescibacteria group bacterium]|nr:hypothetical protein [Patescibacteria group bacterium]
TPLANVTISNIGAGIIRSNTNGVLSSSAINLASSDVTGVLPLANGGTNTNLTAVSGGIVYSGTSGLAITSPGIINQCLVSNGAGTPFWNTCATGASSTNYWQLNNGTVTVINDTLDALIGGQSTTSAKFAFLHVNSGTPTASVSAGITGGVYLTATGNLSTTADQTLTLGGPSTGNIILNPLNGTGTVTLQGYTSGIIRSNTNGVLSASNVNLATTSADITGTLSVVNGGTGRSSFYPQGVIYGNGEGILQETGVGTTNQFLTVDAFGNPVWGNITGGACSNCLLSNPTSTQTIAPTGSTTTGLQVRQTSGASPTVDIFNVENSSGASKYFQVDQNGNVLFPQLSSGIAHINTSGQISSSAVNLASADVTGVLPLANGGTNANLTAINGGIVYSGASGFAISSIGTVNQCLVSGGTGTPSWATCASGNSGINYWQATTPTGAIASINDTLDVLIGGQSTTSAHFGFINNLIGTPTASVSAGSAGATYLTATGTLATTARQTLTLGNSATSGNIVLNPAVLVQINGGLNVSGGINTSNLYLPVTGGVGGFLQLANNVIAPSNLANDFAIGGNSTASAKFQIFANGNATTSGNLTFNTAGLIQTTKMQNLILGGTTTGRITLTGLNGANNGITFQGYSAGILHADTNGTLTSSAVNLASADVTGILPLANGGSNANLTAVSGGIVYSGGSALAISTAGSTGQCLVSGATGTPTWTQCAFGVNYFTQNNGALFPSNPTTDFLIGGNSTASAKFAFLNVNSGTPTASVSAGVNGATFVTATGNIQTTANQNLTLGGGATGN